MTENKERHIPYLATASLYKILENLEQSITMLKASAEISKETEERTYDSIGLTVKDRGKTEAIIDYRGGALDKVHLKSKLRELEVHDISIDEMIVQSSSNGKLSDKIQRKWYDNSGRETEILENLTIPSDLKCYILFENEKCPENCWDSQFFVNDLSYPKWWRNNNICPVCNEPLEKHGFKHTTLNVSDVRFPWIKATVPRNKRPRINAHKNVISSWIYNKICKPTGFGRVYNYRLRKEDQWVLEGV